MALCLGTRIRHVESVASRAGGSISFIQKAFLKNDLPAVQVPGVEARTPKEDQRFPENTVWPDELDWLNTGSHRRPCRPYRPPADVQSQLWSVFRAVLGPAATDSQDTPVGDLASKYRLLAACGAQLGHHVSSSQLHHIKTLGDVVKYYSVPVNTSTPLEQLSEQDLPKNMHVQLEYVRFHPETDTKFGGVTAFPKSSTVVSSIKYKKKYRGYTAPKSWPYH